MHLTITLWHLIFENLRRVPTYSGLNFNSKKLIVKSQSLNLELIYSCLRIFYSDTKVTDLC